MIHESRRELGAGAREETFLTPTRFRKAPVRTEIYVTNADLDNNMTCGTGTQYHCVSVHYIDLSWGAEEPWRQTEFRADLYNLYYPRRLARRRWC